MGIEVGEHGELHTLPAVAWVASFGLCALGDAMMGRWVLLPLFVAAFYAGMIVIALVTYPMLSFWRGWTRRRGLTSWYLIEIGGLWGGTAIVLTLLSPVVDELELERDVIPPSARLRALRRLGDGRDVGGGEDGMGKAAARRRFVPTASWGPKE
jgi:hypothetical protein